ncbi:hypothetical protein BURPS1710b_A2525 [Burkholderia pseudomallei 1710b]|uniref:Uncharacterized protein n=1 Tax=Burkholderia pseudomallei (strain 1710b) TaxID=320372 RepID=Q3JFH8_BURP1|nr:hypothetical protein BURPS1710b_A2525 [Burkholderia pseudomallei 1710b]
MPEPAPVIAATLLEKDFIVVGSCGFGAQAVVSAVVVAAAALANAGTGCGL